MKTIKVGNRLLNEDLITSVTKQDDVVIVTFDANNNIDFSGKEAAHLWKVLAGNSKDFDETAQT